MNPYQSKLFPLSISAYAILFILLGLLLFGGFGWRAVDQLVDLQEETHRRNINLSELELQETIVNVLDSIKTLANQFKVWDETIQQLGNSTYYSYWREYRVPSASFVPDYLSAVEIYDHSGKALATPKDPDMPSTIMRPLHKVTLVNQQDRHNLLYTQVLVHDDKSREISGYIMLKIDFLKAIGRLQRFRYVDPTSIGIDMKDRSYVTERDLQKYLTANSVPNMEFNRLQRLMVETLLRFTLVGIALSSLLLYLFIQIFGLPSRRLSHHIDALRDGNHEMLEDADKDKLPVAEFEKVRLSLNHYQRQLNNRDAALRDSEMRMRAVLENIVDGLITIDEHGLIQSCNPAGCRIFECESTALVGRNITQLLSPGDLPIFQSYCEQRMQSQSKSDLTTGSCELVGIRSSSCEFPMELAISNMEVAGTQVYIIVVRDITERKRAEERLVYLANFDELTGLPNRTLFRDRLHQAIMHAKQEDHLVAVIFFDLDHFKKINDTAGHHVGDQLLIGAAKRLSKSVREFDTVSRLGGDEFMVILDGINNVDEVTDIVTQLLKELENPFLLDGQEAFITASAGIAIYPFDNISVENLVKSADTAMFRAKEQGGNIYQYFRADMNTKAVERLALESALRHALERDEFDLYFQPRINLQSGSVTGMEALLRWRHPRLGNVPPMTFIPLLEETGMIVPVGEWVLKTACTQTRRWHSLGYTNLKVSVNLSVRQFRQKDLVERFLSILETCAFNPAQLELEITESLLVENVESTAEILSAFHAKGIQISIDDFGTGYSSLSYLKRFCIDTLKIDRSFVRDIIDDPDDAVITAGIIALAGSLRMNVVAEGVETKAQLEHLYALHCDEVQGFYFSKPLPTTEFERFLNDHANNPLLALSAPPRTAGKLASK